jgi:hypothetical protein
MYLKGESGDHRCINSGFIISGSVGLLARGSLYIRNKANDCAATLNYAFNRMVCYATSQFY